MEMPLLPLRAVLFPQMALRLQITEQPHLEIVQRCMDADRTFGIVLARSEGASGDIEPYRVGTSAYIIDVTEKPNGRTIILVLGQRRFRLVDFRPGQNFPTGRVEWLPDPGEDAGADVSAVTELLQRYLESVLAQIASVRLSLSDAEIPQDPEELSYAVAALLPLALPEKQRLLELPGPAARLQEEVPLLQQQIEEERGTQDPRGIVRSLGKSDVEWLSRWRN